MNMFIKYEYKNSWYLVFHFLSLFLHLYEKLPYVLPIRNVILTNCNLYEMLPIQSVLYEMLPRQSVLYKILPRQSVLYEMLPRQSVLYEMLPRQNVTILKCYWSVKAVKTLEKVNNIF